MERYIQGKKFILIADTTRKASKTFKKRRDYFIRVKVFHTNHKKYLQQLLDQSDIRCEAYQIALEGDNDTNYHLQAVVKFKEEWRDWARDNFRGHLKSWYDHSICKDERKINSYYSLCQIRENPLRALAYNMKEDSEPLYKNVNEEDIKIAKMLSHGKDLRQLSKRLEDLKEIYFQNKILDVELTKRILLLKAEFNQSIYINRIEGMVRYIMIKKYPDYAYTWAIEIIHRIKDND